MKKIFLLFAVVPFFCAFDFHQFPDLSNESPMFTVYDLEKNIYWEIFDTDKNDVADAALGYEPNEATPIFMMNQAGMDIVWEVDVNGVSIRYYWMDLDGDGLPFSGDSYNYAEILYDSKGDGLNGNEEDSPMQTEIQTKKISI